MVCEEIRQFLLEVDWDASRREQALESLKHLEQCETCRAAMHEFDELRLVLAPAALPEPRDGWESMQRRLVKTIPPARNVWIRPVMAMAATVVLVVLGFKAGQRESTGPARTLATTDKPRVEPPEPAIATPELSHTLKAFRTVSPVYDGYAGWMVVSRGTSEIGILPNPVSSAARMLALRLDLWQNDRSISNADLVVVDGQSADLTLPLKGGRLLHYRVGTSMDDPTRLTIGIEVKNQGGGEPVAAMATALKIQPGHKQTVGKLATTNGDYELKIDFAGAAPASETP